MRERSRPDARARIFGILAEAGAVSRAELARRASLAPSTVSAVVGDLRAEGLVVEPSLGPEVPATGALGRPPVLVALHRRAGVALGIDFGKRHLRLALSDLSHAVLAERYRALDADLPAGEAIALAARLADEMMDETGVGRADLVGAGMGLPGPVHRPSGHMGNSAILPGWVGVRGAEAASEALGVPVEVENDANLGALGEWMWGAGRAAESMVYLKVANGIGAGFVIGGRPYVGAGGTAGEIGHTVVDPDGPICRCGNRGCLESLAAAPAVLADLREAYGEDLTLKEAISRALAGEAGCRRALADAGRTIGNSVAALCNLFNPRRIVVGGDMVAAGDLLLGPMRESLAQSAIRSAVEDVELVEGTLRERGEVLGAVALVLRRVPQLLDGAAPTRDRTPGNPE